MSDNWEPGDWALCVQPFEADWLIPDPVRVGSVSLVERAEVGPPGDPAEEQELFLKLDGRIGMWVASKFRKVAGPDVPLREDEEPLEEPSAIPDLAGVEVYMKRVMERMR